MLKLASTFLRHTWSGLRSGGRSGSAGPGGSAVSGGDALRLAYYSLCQDWLGQDWGVGGSWGEGVVTRASDHFIFASFLSRLW